MNKEKLKYCINDLRCLTIFPRRHKAPELKPSSYWSEVAGRYGNTMKNISASDWHWRIVEFTDGRRELAYLRVLQGGMFSGKYPAIYRGLLFPRRVDYSTFASIKWIRLAF